MRIRDWSSDVCSSDLLAERACGAVFVVVDKRVELVVSPQAGLFAAVLFEQLLTRKAVFLGARVKHLLRGLTEPPFAVVDGKNRNAHCAAPPGEVAVCSPPCRRSSFSRNCKIRRTHD